MPIISVTRPICHECRKEMVKGASEGRYFCVNIYCDNKFKLVDEDEPTTK